MTLMSSVLIANRGEIARRIIRTARRLGLRTIAVYSEADAHAAHVREADVAVPIGPAPARESYLRSEAILEAARQTDAESVHPGYGFLSENVDFAEAVTAAGRLWVGPPASAIRAMGLKDAAKRLMQEAGVPVTPGYLGDDQSEARLKTEAEQIGWPVLIKAVAGGGGKGMRKVERPEDFAAALAAARREAAAAFGEDRVLLEKFVSRPRHIEVQVFADSHGEAVHLFERDCSIQRRHQKVIEEAPAPRLDEAVRTWLCEAAVRAAKAVGYRGAGTIEFIADASEGLRADRIWFMEMNTRLQVEHPVTEAITGLDLVEWQLRIAAGEALPLSQSAIERRGHAIEARLYAEDPSSGFLPSTGALSVFDLSRTIRIDSAVEAGDRVGPHYDPMLAKMIAHAPSREAARLTLAAASRDARVWPVKTNAAFLARCLVEEAFAEGGVDTGYLDQRMAQLTAPPEPAPRVWAAAAAAFSSKESADRDPWARGLFGFRLNRPAGVALTLHHHGRAVEASLEEREPGRLTIVIDGQRFEADPVSPESVEIDGDAFGVHRAANGDQVVFAAGAAFAFSLSILAAADGPSASDGQVLTPMPGRIVSVSVAAGDKVSRGDPLLALEAMKMEHVLTAPCDGTVREVLAREGDQVAEGVVVAVLEPAAS